MLSEVQHSVIRSSALCYQGFNILLSGVQHSVIRGSTFCYQRLGHACDVLVRSNLWVEANLITSRDVTLYNLRLEVVGAKCCQIVDPQECSFNSAL